MEKLNRAIPSRPHRHFLVEPPNAMQPETRRHYSRGNIRNSRYRYCARCMRQSYRCIFVMTDKASVEKVVI